MVLFLPDPDDPPGASSRKPISLIYRLIGYLFVVISLF